MSLSILLISDEMIKERTAIHGNIDPKLLYPEIKLAQDMYIHPILGTALYDKLLFDINVSGTTTGAYKTLLDNYIVDPLMYYVLASLPIPISYQFWNKGVMRKQGDSTELPTMEELVTISDNYRVKAEWYAERLTKYLKTGINGVQITEYQNPGDTLDTITPQNSPFTMPIYLGDNDDCYSMDKNNCRCNE